MKINQALTGPSQKTVSDTDTAARPEASEATRTVDTLSTTPARSCLVDHPGNGTLLPYDLHAEKSRSHAEAFRAMPGDMKNYLRNSWNQGVYKTFVQTFPAKLLRSWQKDISAPLVLKVHEDAQGVIESNAVWAIKHETTYDFINVLPSLVSLNKTKAGLKAIMQTMDASKDPLLWLMLQPVSPFAYQVKRPRVANITDAAKVREAKNYNEDIIASARGDLQNEETPTQVLIFPEGTTCTDGRVIYLHNGVFEMSRDGAPVVPVGLNYDLIAGEKRSDGNYKYRAFMNVGKPFYYKPEKADVKGWSLVKDRIMHYVTTMPKEREIFREHLTERMVDLQTITCGGLMGHEILKLRDAGVSVVDKGTLSSAIEAKVKALSEHSPIDDALLNPAQAELLVEQAWTTLCELGYLTPDASDSARATINLDVLDHDSSGPGNTIDPRVLLLKRAKKAAKEGKATLDVSLSALMIETRKEAKILGGLIGSEELAEDMTSNVTLIRKAGAAWNELCASGWITETDGRQGTLNVDAFINEAADVGLTLPAGRPYEAYKKDNPLRFCANSLRQKAKYNSAIKSILDES